jgi:hypothetical protein
VPPGALMEGSRSRLPWAPWSPESPDTTGRPSICDRVLEPPRWPDRSQVGQVDHAQREKAFGPPRRTALVGRAPARQPQRGSALSQPRVLARRPAQREPSPTTQPDGFDFALEDNRERPVTDRSLTHSVSALQRRTTPHLPRGRQSSRLHSLQQPLCRHRPAEEISLRVPTAK